MMHLTPSHFILSLHPKLFCRFFFPSYLSCPPATSLSNINFHFLICSPPIPSFLVSPNRHSVNASSSLACRLCDRTTVFKPKRLRQESLLSYRPSLSNLLPSFMSPLTFLSSYSALPAASSVCACVRLLHLHSLQLHLCLLHFHT